MNGRTLAVILAVLVVLGAAWFLLKGNFGSVPAPTTSETGTSAATTSPTTSGATVTYTDQGFSPASITVPVGTIVTFVNQGSEGMWVASAMHPTHALYSGTALSEHCPDASSAAFDECAAVGSGGSYSFTFMKAGAWRYHNHVDASQTGTVTVTAE